MGILDIWGRSSWRQRFATPESRLHRLGGVPDFSHLGEDEGSKSSVAGGVGSEMSWLKQAGIREEIERRVTKNLRPVSSYVGAALVVVAGVHAIWLRPPEATVGAAVFLACGLTALGVRGLLAFRSPRPETSRLIVALLLGLVFIALQFNYWSYGSPRYFSYAFVLLAGTGTLFYSIRVLAVVLAAAALTFLSAALRHVEGELWVDAIVSLALACSVSLTVQGVRLRIMRRSVQRRMLDTRRREDLEDALASVVQRGAQAAERSVRDPLTGAYNRRHLEELEFSLVRPTAVWGVLMVDLDDFKDVNDRFGHEEGDRVLRSVAHFIRRYGRAEDQLVRFGGDEFVLLIDVKSEDEVAMVARRLREASKRESPISLSIGYAVRRPGEEILDVVRRADEDMYRDKSRLRAVPSQPHQRGSDPA